MTLNIEWDSDFHADGRRRNRPKASTVHGWLAKMRGTLVGDERLRSRGIREMKEARAIRAWKKKWEAEQGRPLKTGMGLGLSFLSRHKSQKQSAAGSARAPVARPSQHSRQQSYQNIQQQPQRSYSHPQPQRSHSRSQPRRSHSQPSVQSPGVPSKSSRPSMRSPRPSVQSARRPTQSPRPASRPSTAGSRPVGGRSRQHSQRSITSAQAQISTARKQ